MIIHALLVLLLAIGLFAVLAIAFVGAWLLVEKIAERHAARRERRRVEEARFRHAIHFAKWDAQIDGGPWWDELVPQMRREQKRLPGCEP